MSDKSAIDDLFLEALKLTNDHRDAFVEGCSGDPAIRAKLAALLRAHDAEPGFLETPVVAPPEDLTVDASGTEAPGVIIDRYKLLQRIGEGGFGSVWMAEQKVPVKRRVALKIIKLGMDTKQVIARFEAERQALAMMDHPNIAKVLDAGATEMGRPYFVMEYVRGVGILEYCDTEKLDTNARLRLFMLVCQAIQHAHQKGIIHRDIKPSNVMVTMHDGVPVPKVIDFGVAKATNTELTQRTLFTEHRQMIGTPAYMSPEQAEMSGLDIDTRSDIYSLGVLLYELLTGTTPFDAHELSSKGFAEMMRIIREQEPHKPSTRLSTLGETATRTAELRRADARRLGGILRGDLDWIVMKCLEKDRTRRYETANGLVADLERHLQDQPVIAGPPSRVYRVSKFLRRNRAGVATAAFVLVALVLGVGIATFGLVDARQERDRYRAAMERIDRIRDVVSGGRLPLAVLPLEVRSVDGETDYLADGLTSSLVDGLTRMSSLRVTTDESVRSALRYTEPAADLSSIASDLDVQTLVTGWVEPTTDGVRLTVKVIAPDAGGRDLELAEHAYEYDMRNLQALERQVSRDILADFQLDLSAEDEIRLASARQVDPEAQVAYLKGTHLLKEQTRGSLLRARDFFDEAIRLDDGYAAAYAGRSHVYARMENDFAAPIETMPFAQADAERALELDPALADAHAAIGKVEFNFNWNWDAADTAFRRAIDLEPNNAQGYVYHALFLAAMGDGDGAMGRLEEADRLDPFALINHGENFLVASFMSRRYERTIRYADQAILLDPELWFPYVWRALALAEQGRFAQAIASADESRRLAESRELKDPEDRPAHLIYAALGSVCAQAADVEADPRRAAALDQRAQSCLDRVDVLGKDQFVCPYETAMVHFALGEMDQAYSSLHEAIVVSSPCIPWVGVDPRLDGLRSDDRFLEVIYGDERVVEILRRTGHIAAPPAGAIDG